MVGDVVVSVELMVAIGDGGDLETLGPDAAFGCEAERRDGAGGTGLCESGEVADMCVEGLVAGCGVPRVGTRGLLGEDELCEDVKVVIVDGARDNLYLLMDQGRDEFIARNGTRFGRQTDWLVGVGPGVVSLSGVLRRVGRVAVVAFDVFAVVSGSPTAFVASGPRAVGISVEMIPAVPCIDDADAHGSIVHRKKPTGWNPWASFVVRVPWLDQ